MIGATIFLALFGLFLGYGELVPQEIMGPILFWMIPFGLVIVILYLRQSYRELRSRKTTPGDQTRLLPEDELRCNFRVIIASQ